MHFLASLASVTEFLTDAGRTLGAWIVWMNIWTLALLIAAIVLDRLLAKRLSAAWRLGLYLIVFARLALPVEWASPLAWTSSAEVPPTVHYYETLAGEATASKEVASNATDAAIASEQIAPAFNFSMWMLLPIGYSAIVLVLSSRWLAARMQLARMLRSTTLADEDLRSLASCRRIDLHETFGPAVVGLVRPRIVLPAELVRTTPRDTLATILAHERAHLLRGDHLMAALIQLATILAWPILPVWIAAARVRRLMELACDEHALAATDTETRRAYGEQLLALATSARPGFSSPAVGHLGLGGDLPARLLALRTIGARRWPRVLQAVLIMLSAGMLIACATHHRAPLSAAPGALPETVTYMVEVRVYNGWVRHEKLSFDLRQTANSDSRPSSAHVRRSKNVLNADEFTAALNEFQSREGASIMMSPRVMTLPGQQAMITVGADPNDADEPASGLTAVLRVSPVVGGLRLEAKYTEYGVPIDNDAVDETSGSISTGMQRLTLQSGETYFTVATGYIGQDTRMVSYTVHAIAPGDAIADANERWNVLLIAYDTNEEIPADLLPAEAPSRFTFDVADRRVVGARLTEERAHALGGWLQDHGTLRMGMKPGYKTLPNLGAMTWDIPHMAFGGDSVEPHSLTLGLGRSIDEPVHMLFRVRNGAIDDDESWQTALSEEDHLTLIVPLADGKGTRVLFLSRERFQPQQEFTPQTADGFIKDADGRQIDIIDDGFDDSIPPPRIPD